MWTYRLQTVSGCRAECSQLTATTSHCEQQRCNLDHVLTDHQQSISRFEPSRRENASKTIGQRDEVNERQAATINYVQLTTPHNITETRIIIRPRARRHARDMSSMNHQPSTTFNLQHHTTTPHNIMPRGDVKKHWQSKELT